MPDSQLINELRDALVRLDDLPYLENHPLAERLGITTSGPDLCRAQALRRTLRWAIAALDPGARDVGQVEARSYWVLYHYAISGQSVMAIADRLGLSRRQTYRELQRGLEGLAAILTESHDTLDALAQPNGAATGDQVKDELERLAWVSERELPLAPLVREVIAMVQPLASQSGIEVATEGFVQDVSVIGNRVLWRQALLNLLSHAVGVHRGARILLRMHKTEAYVSLELIYRQHEPVNEFDPHSPYFVALQLLDQLNAHPDCQVDPDGLVRLRIQVALRQDARILVVDDNEGFIALFRRYLAHQPYVVEGASDLPAALDKIASFRPDIIVLDIMMPDMDGWEALQRIRAHPAGRAARLIMCSVINDPKLAHALGAEGFVSKPVDRMSLLQALDSVLSEG
ncbi:MAG: response regulator [Anaerolineae bacterium]